MNADRGRSGGYARQPTGYRAFVPAPLPPDPPLVLDGELVRLLSQADLAIGRLDGVARTLPNPDLFVAMYVRREAVLSSQIEGTQSTLQDVLAFELDARGVALPRDVVEVVNYARAMNYGLSRLDTLPLSLRLIREIHGQLMEGVRGQERQPGEFRTSQNWIGPPNTPLAQAIFVPPAVHNMWQALDNFERFLHDEELPTLVHCALAHAQFETIHPFLDGNGRVGRLLISLLLVERSVLRRPLLYLSHYLKRHQTEYYDRLSGVREPGGWEDWLRFFLVGVRETAEEAVGTAHDILELRETHRALIERNRLGGNALRLLDALYETPLASAASAARALGVTFPTASKLLDQFATLGLVRETTGARRSRRYLYEPYVALLGGGEELRRPTPPQRTNGSRALSESARSSPPHTGAVEFPPLTAELLDEIVRRVLAMGDPTSIVLFGSRARGDARPDSDLDLLIIEETTSRGAERDARYYRALRGVYPAKDIQVWTPGEVEEWRQVPNSFIMTVLREGKVLYAR